MTDAEKNRVIAEAISPEREGWAWKKCSRCDGTSPTCRACHGTGRVPVELHAPPYTLLVVEWAAQREWWDDCQMLVEETLTGLMWGHYTAKESAGRIRDIVYEAVCAARISTPKAKTPKAGGKDE